MSAILDYLNDLFDDRAAAADPNDQSPRANGVRAACDWAASKGDSGFGGVVIAGNPIVQGTCRPYWDGQPYDVPEEGEVPFTGGQCEGTRYRVTIQNGVVRREFGPIVGIRKEQIAPNSFVALLVYEGGAGETQVDSGPTLESLDDSAIVSVVAEIGPDDCGDPPRAPIEPVNVPGAPVEGQPFDISPPGNPGPPITITIQPPEVRPTGEPYFPIESPFGPGTIFDPPGGVDSPPSAAPGSPEDVSDPSGEVNDEPTEEEEDKGLVTIGYEFILTGLSAWQSVVSGVEPRSFTRVAGNLQLIYEDQSGTRFYGGDLQIRSQRGSIYRSDSSLKVTGVRYTKVPEISGIRLTPIKARKEE